MKSLLKGIAAAVASVLFYLAILFFIPYTCSKFSERRPKNNKTAESIVSTGDLESAIDFAFGPYSFHKTETISTVLAIKYNVSTNLTKFLTLATSDPFLSPDLDIEILQQTKPEVLIPALSKKFDVPEEKIAAILFEVMLYGETQNSSL